MKELSIEEKARRYDEVVNKLKGFMAQGVDPLITRADAQDFFPELQESEDERIRKVLVELVKCNERCGYFMINNTTTSSMLAWLEKQGRQKEYTFKSIPRLLDMIEPTDRAKAYCQKLIDTLAKEGYNTDTKIVEEVLNGWNGENIPMAVMDEQKPINKIEPKFKVGDWIVTNKNHIWYIDETPETTSYLYRLINQYGKVEVAEFEVVDNVARLWTIQDAKDGDMLCCESGWTCIFKKLNHNSFGGLLFDSYCFIDRTGWFCDGAEGHTLDERINGRIYPATKEQCDTLIKAMADAGYTFDFKKKELKKIEQKPTWSEEDEDIINKILCICDDFAKSFEISPASTKVIKEDIDKIDNWLKSLKDRYTWKPSEFDVKILEQVIDGTVNPINYHATLHAILGQLKKLREE